MISRRTMLVLLGYVSVAAVIPSPIAADEGPVRIPVDIDVAADMRLDALLVKNKYRSRIRADGVVHDLGLHATALAAHQAALHLAKELHGEFARAA